MRASPLERDAETDEISSEGLLPTTRPMDKNLNRLGPGAVEFLYSDELVSGISSERYFRSLPGCSRQAAGIEKYRQSPGEVEAPELNKQRFPFRR